MDGAIFFGASLIAYAIGSGLHAIARAIAQRTVTVNFNDPLRVEHSGGK